MLNVVNVNKIDTETKFNRLEKCRKKINDIHISMTVHLITLTDFG